MNTVGENEEFQNIYLLNTSGEVIFAPFEKGVGLVLDNEQPDCQPCHALSKESRPSSIVVEDNNGQRIFRSMEPIENSPECAECHNVEDPLIGMLLIDMPVEPFSATLAAGIKQDLLWWLAFTGVTLIVVNVVLDRAVLRRIEGVAKAMSLFKESEDPPKLREDGSDEIGRLVGAFNTMGDQIRNRDAHNRQLSDRLQRQNKVRGELLRRLITAQEDERKRVARELHDELGQSLTGLALRTNVLERTMTSDLQKAGLCLDQMRSLVAETTDRMYEIILDLRPSALDDLGLIPALRAYADRLVETSDLQYTIVDDAFDGHIPPEIETVLFRLFQESLTNTVRHAEATSVRLTLANDNGVLEAEILDNGVGFDVASVRPNGAVPGGLGLIGMQERVAQCGGEMRIHTAPGAGARIIFKVPVGDLARE